MPNHTTERRPRQQGAHRLPGALVDADLHDLTSGDSLTLNTDAVFHAAITMKVPVMIGALRNIADGGSRPSSRLRCPTGSPRSSMAPRTTLKVGDDFDSTLYDRVSQSLAPRGIPPRGDAQRLIAEIATLA